MTTRLLCLENLQNEYSSNDKLAQVQKNRVELAKPCMLKPIFEALVHVETNFKKRETLNKTCASTTLNTRKEMVKHRNNYND